ncbi:hypothetical protein CLAFUW4_20050 [Fulvia fulva]|uniref:uncharacterized protein n=1 Tax=Passalora fulva TaxID=5499 RepID=UPI0028525D7C|nr:uncharacterized protein CLAFUR5_20050 [Fulvia fulva]KAK4624041.1 hypothetical protein CLAFUR4_20050 [Fulvia fulva]KAK4625967.1 hypothetical protein CLAFUR0_20050 [Fulvia fulva]WMI38907.1 hypothetical protein CLAFUR5_20050 [Fulvia fulva]WPV15071.1 hypothetical protein CLAFUW4_20050 [Fulvia fulva]WPV29929.1 hypothetical protein CLAFUW7_20050 [Fulvia fulva]
MKLLIAAKLSCLLALVTAINRCVKPAGAGYCSEHGGRGQFLRCSDAKPCFVEGNGCVFHWGREGPSHSEDSYANCS